MASGSKASVLVVAALALCAAVVCATTFSTGWKTSSTQVRLSVQNSTARQLELEAAEKVKKTADSTARQLELEKVKKTAVVAAIPTSPAARQAWTPLAKMNATSSKLAIFVYPLPAELNMHWLNGIGPASLGLDQQQHRRHTSCLNSMYSTEIRLHQAVMASPFRTADPSLASLFMIPFYATCAHDVTGGDRSASRKVAREALSFVRGQWPYFNRSGGRDHFAVASFDDGPCLLYDDGGSGGGGGSGVDVRGQEWEQTFFLTPLGDTTRPGCFKDGVDIVIPPYVRPPLHRYGAVNATNHLERERIGEQRRSVFAFFRGETSYRPGLKVLASARGFRVNAGHVAPSTYEAELYNSTFCLCPPGWVSWTSRLFQVMQYGCIPVLSSDLPATASARPGFASKAAATRLPFEGVVDWDQFVVRSGENSERGRSGVEIGNTPMPTLLRSLTSSDIRHKQAALAKASGMFLYHQDQPRTSSPAQQPGRAVQKARRPKLNAITLIMSQLAEKAAALHVHY